jgi:hypothetical protein
MVPIHENAVTIPRTSCEPLMTATRSVPPRDFTS